MSWRVCIPSDGESLDSLDAFDVDAEPNEDPQDVAIAAAQSCWDNWAWEAQWPITFRLRNPAGAVFDVMVEMEAEPTFFAFEPRKVPPVDFVIVDEACHVTPDMIEAVTSSSSGVAIHTVNLSDEDRKALSAGPQAVPLKDRGKIHWGIDDDEEIEEPSQDPVPPVRKSP